MAETKISDIIVPELFNPYVINRTMELSALVNSGIIVNSPEFDRLASEAARTHNMPFFEDLTGDSEETLEGNGSGKDWLEQRCIHDIIKTEDVGGNKSFRSTGRSRSDESDR